MKPAPTTIPLASVLLAFVGLRPGAIHNPGDLPDQSSDRAGGGSGNEMVFEREVFTYPANGRRNPFVPVGNLSADGPRIEDTRLLGIIHHPDSAYSLVLLGISGGQGGTRDILNADTGAGTGRATVRLRLGEVLGRLRIARIREDHIVIEADLPQGPATEVLTISRPAVGRRS